MQASRFYRFLLLLAILVNFSGLFLIILGTDGTLYASVARIMARDNNYLELFAWGQDWLDKPHFPFWMTALSFEIFGANSWSYKLPGILFMLGGAWYTWAFARRFYAEHTALWSVLILLTAQHIILSNTDVRAEAYLTPMIIGATYHFHRAWTEKKFLQLVLAAFMTALAIMTKGIFVVITIGAAVLIHLVISKQFREIFHWRWLAAGLLVLLFISPELYALYVQFDLHPEKTVFGTRNVSGLKFFFWDSQFGRFFNTGPIKGKGDPSFFLHTTLWAFLPWSILLYAALFKRFRRLKDYPEWYCLGGAAITFLLFSLSRFQLPHYLNIVFPYFAIITAQHINDWKNEKILRTIQYVLIALLLAAPIALHLFFRPGIHNLALLLVMTIILLALLFLPRLFTVPAKDIIIGRTVLAAVLINIYLNGFFYPKLLTYQGGTSAAQYVNEKYPGIPLAQLKDRWNNPLEFYLDAPLVTINSIADTVSLPRPCLLLVHEDDDKLGMIPLQSFNDFRIAKLNGKFLNPEKREQQLKKLNLYARF